MSKFFEGILQESYTQEHSDAVMLANKKLESWLDLIIWDLLEIQDVSKRLIETNSIQKFQHCLDILKEDIEIWNRLPQSEKYKRIHDIDIGTESDLDKNVVSLKD